MARRTARDPTPCETEPHGCEVADLFRILGKAHMLDLLSVLIHEDEPRRGEAAGWRFVDLQTRLDLSPTTLSDRLKVLVEAGLVTRTPYNEIPPRVDYAPTAKALDLKPVFDLLTEWAARHDLEPAPPSRAAAA